MANTIQAVIWDLDGVIIDSAEEHRKAWHRLAQEEGVPFTDEQFWATFGWRNDAIIPLIYGPVSPERLQELADRKEAYFREYIQNTVAPLPGAIELMSALHAVGYKQGLGTSTPIANIEVISKALGLERFLSALVSGETVPHGKPAPDIFLKVAEKLGVALEHCLVIEDAVAGIAAARAGGMYSIAVAGERDLPGLRVANLVVNNLTQVNVETIQQLA